MATMTSPPDAAGEVPAFHVLSVPEALEAEHLRLAAAVAHDHLRGLEVRERRELARVCTDRHDADDRARIGGLGRHDRRGGEEGPQHRFTSFVAQPCFLIETRARLPKFDPRRGFVGPASAMLTCGFADAIVT